MLSSVGIWRPADVRVRKTADKAQGEVRDCLRAGYESLFPNKDSKERIPRSVTFALNSAIAELSGGTENHALRVAGDHQVLIGRDHAHYAFARCQTDSVRVRLIAPLVHRDPQILEAAAHL